MHHKLKCLLFSYMLLNMNQVLMFVSHHMVFIISLTLFLYLLWGQPFDFHDIFLVMFMSNTFYSHEIWVNHFPFTCFWWCWKLLIIMIYGQTIFLALVSGDFFFFNNFYSHEIFLAHISVLVSSNTFYSHKIWANHFFLAIFF